MSSEDIQVSQPHREHMSASEEDQLQVTAVKKQKTKLLFPLTPDPESGEPWDWDEPCDVATQQESSVRRAPDGEEDLFETELVQQGIQLSNLSAETKQSPAAKDKEEQQNHESLVFPPSSDSSETNTSPAASVSDDDEQRLHQENKSASLVSQKSTGTNKHLSASVSDVPAVSVETALAEHVNEQQLSHEDEDEYENSSSETDTPDKPLAPCVSYRTADFRDSFSHEHDDPEQSNHDAAEPAIVALPSNHQDSNTTVSDLPAASGKTHANEAETKHADETEPTESPCTTSLAASLSVRPEVSDKINVPQPSRNSRPDEQEEQHTSSQLLPNKLEQLSSQAKQDHVMEPQLKPEDASPICQERYTKPTASISDLALTSGYHPDAEQKPEVSTKQISKHMSASRKT